MVFLYSRGFALRALSIKDIRIYFYISLKIESRPNNYRKTSSIRGTPQIFICIRIKSVSETKYAKEFALKPDNLALIAKGKAPLVLDSSQEIGKRIRYELHHLEPIFEGGNVYDLSNIIVATPLFHVNVFHK